MNEVDVTIRLRSRVADRSLHEEAAAEIERLRAALADIATAYCNCMLHLTGSAAREGDIDSKNVSVGNAKDAGLKGELDDTHLHRDDAASN